MIGILGSTYIITGASSGIGRSLSYKLAKKNANLVLASRNIDELKQIAKKINASGGNALSIQTDITNIDSCKALIAETIDKFGQIDYLILNAGLSMWSRVNEINDITHFEKLLDVNYTGAVNCVHSALNELEKTKGSIIAITTAQAMIGFSKATAYSASKHALQGFLEGLDMEMQGRINIINVYLGWIKGTNLRANAIGPDGKRIGNKHHKHSNKAVDLEDCTNRIINGITKRKKAIYVPYYLKFIPFAKLFLRNWLFNKISRTIDSEERE